MAADGLGIAEDFRIEGSEMVADAGMAVFHGVVGRGALREAGGEEFHQHGVAVAFVAAEQLAAAAQGIHAAAQALAHAFHNNLRVGFVYALAVNRPAQWGG